MNATEAVFRSIDHPGRTPWALLIAREGIRPLSVVLLPLMIITLVMALMSGDVLRFVLWGYPIAAMISTAWTLFNVDRRPAEIRIDSGHLVLRTMADVARGKQGRRLPLFDVRDYGSWMVIAAGDIDLTLDRSTWPEYARIKDRARQAVEDRTTAL
jgi:hypothetical protein